MSRRLLDGKITSSGGKGGRPTDLTPELLDKIVPILRIGVRVQTAFAFNEIPYDTMRMWIDKGQRNPESIYGELIRRVTRAVAEYEIRDINVLERHANGAPAEYEMEVARNKDGSVVVTTHGEPVMQIARDKAGNPIVKRSEVKSDYKAALERIKLRFPKIMRDHMDNEDELLVSAANGQEERDVGPQKSLGELVAEEVKKLDDEF